MINNQTENCCHGNADLHKIDLKIFRGSVLPWQKYQLIARNYVWLINRRIIILPQKHRITRNGAEESSVVQCFRGKKYQLITRNYVANSQKNKNIATETQNYTEQV